MFVRQDVLRRQCKELPGTYPGIEQDVKSQLHGRFFNSTGEPLIFFMCPYFHFIGPVPSNAACGAAWIGSQAVMVDGIIHNSRKLVVDRF